MKFTVRFFIFLFAFIGLSVQLEGQLRKGKYWQHKLEFNESFSQLARKYGVSASQIRAINEKNEDPNILNIPVAIKKNGFRKQRGKYLLHRVRSKEAIHRLAHRYQTTRKKLIQLNNLREGVITPGQLLLVPNSPFTTENSMIGYLAFGFSSSTDWEGKTRANYSINSRYNFRKKIQKPPFQIITDFRTAIGFRHEFGKRFYKNIDRIELRTKVEYAINEKLSAFLNTNFRSQLLNTYIYKRDGSRRITTSPFAPAYTNLSAGFTFFNTYLNVDISPIDVRVISVLKQDIYEYRDIAFGVKKGQKFSIEPGVSITADLFYYQDRKLEINSNTYIFANTKNVVIDFRNTISFQVNKVLKIAAVFEVYKDNDFSDFVQIRQKILTGFTFRK